MILTSELHAKQSLAGQNTQHWLVSKCEVTKKIPNTGLFLSKLKLTEEEFKLTGKKFKLTDDYSRLKIEYLQLNIQSCSRQDGCNVATADASLPRPLDNTLLSQTSYAHVSIEEHQNIEAQE